MLRGRTKTLTAILSRCGIPNYSIQFSMATVASLVANPILLRNNRQKFSAAKLSATCNSRHAPKFNSARVKCFFSAADLTNTTTNYSKNSGRHASLCKRPHAIKDHLGIGKPLAWAGRWKVVIGVSVRCSVA